MPDDPRKGGRSTQRRRERQGDTTLVGLPVQRRNEPRSEPRHQRELEPEERRRKRKPESRRRRREERYSVLDELG